jgi:hypothetical protein
MHLRRRGKGLSYKQLATEILKLSAAELMPPISLDELKIIPDNSTTNAVRASKRLKKPPTTKTNYFLGQKKSVHQISIHISVSTK